MTTKCYCSFCGKSQDEVVCLVAGPTVFICNECTLLCAGICEQHRIAKLVREAIAKQGVIAPINSEGIAE